VLEVFTDIVLPVLAIVGLGALVGRWRRLQAQPLATLVLYLLAPTLVFHTLSRTELSIDVAARVAIVMTITLGAMLALSLGWSTWRGHGAAMRSGFALVATSPNFGNMGLAIATLAFGDLGLEVAVLTFVLGALLSNTVGVAVGSMAERAQWKRAVATPLRFPFIYAAAAGVAVNASAIDLPVAVTQPAAILAGAAIPVMLVVLGVQISHGLHLGNATDLGAVTIARLVVAPAVTWAVTGAVGLHGVAQATLVTVAAMPAAVITTIIATEFDASPSFVTRAVVLSTLVSMITLTVLIHLVR
jgi:predicted permease